jgi:nitrite reductase (cytochrome c-552)
VLFESIDASRQGQLALRDPKYKATVAIVAIPPPPAPPAAAPAPAVVPAVAK